MADRIDALKYNLGQGARSSRYRVEIASSFINNGDMIDALCKGGSIPSKTIGQIPVYNQGKKLMIAGDTTFDNTWDLTFYNDEAHSVRAIMENWMDTVDNFIENTHAESPSDYMAEATITQLGSSDNDVRQWKFYNLYPMTISAVEMADESVDTISEFTVTFSYSHWEPII
jgi:hypothetical protein